MLEGFKQQLKVLQDIKRIVVFSVLILNPILRYLWEHIRQLIL